MNKKVRILTFAISLIFIFSFILILKENINLKTNIKQITKQTPITANVAMLSKPLGTTTFTEITSTPTTGSWTIETDCRGMSVTWDDKTHKLKTSVTQTPASCKLKFIEKEVPKPTLRDAILANNTVRNVENDSMFAHVSPADKSENGLWKEARPGKTEGDKPTYFFRGSVQNNYVSFAGKMWRIVRINEDGTVKLILGGNSTEDGYIDSITHVWHPINGEQNINYVESTAKKNIDTWYNSNITGTKNNKVATWNVCNDKSSTQGIISKEYGALDRNSDAKKPQFICPNASDNIAVKGGLLTADEVAYAGGVYGSNGLDYYLYDNAKQSGNAGYWWVSSPFGYNSNDGNTRMFIVYGSDYPGNLNYYNVSSAVGLRVVISLVSDTLTVSGEGTQTSPYVI